MAKELLCKTETMELAYNLGKMVQGYSVDTFLKMACLITRSDFQFPFKVTYDRVYSAWRHFVYGFNIYARRRLRFDRNEKGEPMSTLELNGLAPKLEQNELIKELKLHSSVKRFNQRMYFPNILIKSPALLQGQPPNAHADYFERLVDELDRIQSEDDLRAHWKEFFINGSAAESQLGSALIGMPRMNLPDGDDNNGPGTPGSIPGPFWRQ